MILSIPYAYRVLGYEPRRQKPETDARRGIVDVIVEEVDPADAPVAALWKRGRKFEHRGELNDIVLRSHAGGLWVPVSQQGRSPGNAASPGPSGNELLATLAECKGTGNPFSHHASHIPPAGRPEKVFRREVSTDRDEVEAAVRATASEVVMIEGVLHVRCPEPVLVQRGNGFDGFLRELQISWCDPGGYLGAEPKDVYRLDEWDALLVDARRGAADMERPCDLPDDLDWVEVRDASAFNLPTEAAALSRAVASLYHEMGSVLRRCAETGREEVNRRQGSGGEGGRDPMAWDKPYTVEIPDASLVEAYVGLGRLMRAGLDEAAMEEVRALGAEHAGLFEGSRDDDDHRRWKYSDVHDGWTEVMQAFARWDARPERLRTSDMESLAALDV